MAIDAWHELGPVAGACRMCGTHGRLLLGEFRSRPDLRDRLRGVRRETTSRLVSCQACDWRWTVRKDDDAAAAATTVRTRDTSVPAQPRPSTARRQTARPTLTQRVPLHRGRHGRTPTPVLWPRSCDRREPSRTG